MTTLRTLVATVRDRSGSTLRDVELARIIGDVAGEAAQAGIGAATEAYWDDEIVKRTVEALKAGRRSG